MERQPLYEEIVLLAKKCQWPEQTAIKGLWIWMQEPYAYGKLLRLSEDLPVIIEIVDSEKRSANSYFPRRDGQRRPDTIEKLTVMYRGPNRADRFNDSSKSATAPFFKVE